MYETHPQYHLSSAKQRALRTHASSPGFGGGGSTTKSRSRLRDGKAAAAKAQVKMRSASAQAVASVQQDLDALFEVAVGTVAERKAAAAADYRSYRTLMQAHFPGVIPKPHQGNKKPPKRTPRMSAALAGEAKLTPQMARQLRAEALKEDEPEFAKNRRLLPAGLAVPEPAAEPTITITAGTNNLGFIR